MQHLAPLLAIAGIYLVVLASPGPNFFILSQLALDGRSREARYVALGVSTGSIFWVAVSLAGLSTLLARYHWLGSAVKLLGAAYLICYGGRLLRGAIARQRAPQSAAPATPMQPGSRLAAYRTGLLTGMTNPKAAAFWTGAFAAIFPLHAPLWMYPVTVSEVLIMSLTWHLGIVALFAAPSLRAAYLRIQRALNGVAGGVLIALGLQRMVGR